MIPSKQRVAEILAGKSSDSRAGDLRDLGAYIAQLEAQRGGAVVAAVYPPGYQKCTTCEHLNDCPERLGEPFGNPCRSWQYCERRDWRTQPIPASQVLQPGMVQVDREAIELAIQWYHAVQDLNPAFLDPEDVAAYERIKALRSQAGGEG